MYVQKIFFIVSILFFIPVKVFAHKELGPVEKYPDGKIIYMFTNYSNNGFPNATKYCAEKGGRLPTLRELFQHATRPCTSDIIGKDWCGLHIMEPNEVPDHYSRFEKLKIYYVYDPEFYHPKSSANVSRIPVWNKDGSYDNFYVIHLFDKNYNNDYRSADIDVDIYYGRPSREYCTSSYSNDYSHFEYYFRSGYNSARVVDAVTFNHEIDICTVRCMFDH
ncbi:MAG: hypothetical protein SGI74_11775 [Oligoflexia bacterium]|nr:hypothetical protein [Oligoflexia bacterium]